MNVAAIVRAPFRKNQPENATDWDLLVALLQRLSFASLATDPIRNPRIAPLVGYFQPRYPMLSESFVRREVNALRGEGLRVRVFALERGDPELLEAGASEGVTWFGPDNPTAARAFLRKAFREHPWRVVMLGLWVVRSGRQSFPGRDRDSFLRAGQLAAELRRANVTHVHAPWADRQAVVAFVAARLIGASFTIQARASEVHRVISSHGLVDRLRFARFVITNSDYNERHLRTLLDSPSPPLHVVRNGLDLSQFPAREPGRRPGGPFRILSVGRLVEPKGFKHLLNACRDLLDRGHNITCDIIGGRIDPMDTVTWIELKLLHQSLGLGSRVVFRGSRSFAEVMDAFHHADLFALPCVRGRDGSHDITPNSLIEAMAMSLPVVSTRSGAIPEIVDDEINGLLVPSEDAVALANAIERLILDGALRDRLGAAARSKVESRYDARKNAAERARLLRSVMTQKS